jgi:hypothetical protein
MPRHTLHLIGVCVGTTRFSGGTSKIELYGLANDLLPLATGSHPVWAASRLRKPT